MSQSITANQEKGPSLLEMTHTLLAALWRRRHVIILPMMLLPIVGLVVGKFAPRTYETKMTILIQDTSKASPAVTDISVGTNLKDRMEPLKALLTSHRVLQGVAEDLGMIPKDAPRATQDAVVSSLESAIQVRLIGNELLEFTYKAGNPKGMDKVLARVGQRFVERVMAPQDSSEQESVKFLEKQIKDAEADLSQADTDLAIYKGQHAQTLPDQRQSNLGRLAQLRDQLNDRETQLAGAESEFKAIRTRLLQTDPVIGRLEQEIVAASTDLAQLKARYTDTHSLVVAAERKLERLEEEHARLIEENRNAPPVDMDRLWNMAITTASKDDNKQPLLVSQVASLEELRARTEKLKTECENLRKNIKTIEDMIQESGDVEREVLMRGRSIQTKADLVQSLRRRYDTARTASDLSVFEAPERVKLVDAPFEPTSPTRPMTLIFVLAGIFGGIFLGISMSAFLEMLDPSIRRKREMERILGAPVLDRIPPLPAS